MLDGRIDVHGMVKDLRSQGVLDGIAKEEAYFHRDEGEATTEEAKTMASNDIERENGGKTRKLVKDEEREAGRVKWKIYNTYLKAS